jgi:hypothetical protein
MGIELDIDNDGAIDEIWGGLGVKKHHLGPYLIRPYDSIADLVADPDLELGRSYVTMGNGEVADGGHAKYYCVILAGFSGTPDDIINHYCLSGTAVLVLIPDGDTINILQAGVKKDGSIDSQINTLAALGQFDKITVPRGDYLYSGTTYTIADTFTIQRNGFTSTNNIYSIGEITCLKFLVETADTFPQDTRATKIPISINITALGGNRADGIHISLISDGDAGVAVGNTGIYCRATSGENSSWCAAVHGETRHAGGTTIGVSSEVATYSQDGAAYGFLANSVSGAAATHSLTGELLQEHPDSNAFCAVASADHTWKYGLRFKGDTINPVDGITIYDASSAWTGMYLAGVYTSGVAIKIISGQKFAWNGPATITTRYDVDTGRLVFANSTDVKSVSFDLVSTGTGMYVNGTKVVGEQGALIADAAGGTEVATINAILARLRAHGIIAT